MKKHEHFLNRFAARKTVLSSNLFAGVTDIHSHYLPGVDDGFKESEDSVEALRKMVDWGVERIYLTPHVMADLPENRPDFLKERFSSFVQEIPEGIELRLSAEYMLDASFYDQLNAGLLPLGENHILIEMSYLFPSLELLQIIYDLSLRGYIPLLAHPERYLYMNEQQYVELKEKGCRFQLNLMSLSGQYGKRSCDVAWFLLQKGMYDFVASDIHHLRVFRHNMERLKLTEKELDLLRNLFRQNDLLW